ncbi:MAG TPA: hypothetical protein VFE05_09985, partial [Longimicrobiaceae bacterium]|nr:hypothetical protein [Longimicrobiaceae bacterium]
MATAIDRILDLLPHTFRARPRPTALHSLADAFGGELLSAGNALAEVLRAHWADHADRGETEILDLALIAALYGLKPREAPFPEEPVEEFRDHLKRYVRTFLDGTSTVRGVLRVTAETLGLRIDDDEAHMDAWWRRADDSVTAVLPLLDDAARAVLGFARAEAAGTESTPAILAGPVLPAAIDLRGHSTLVLSADAGGETEVDLAAAVADPSQATLAEVVAAIEAALPGVASAGDGRLVLRSPTAGAAGRLEVHDHPADAAPVLLGLAPRGYRGRPEATARIVGAHDLSLGVELGGARYLRGVVDRATTIEPDLDPARTGTVALQDVIDAINHEVPHLAAEADGRLVLASRAPGAAGSLAVQAPAAHDAAGVLLGPAARVAVGRDPSPALLRGLADLSDGLALPPGMRLRVEVDGGPAVDVDLSALAGPEVDPNAVAQLLSAALAPAACAFDGRFLRLVSAERGTAGTIVLPSLPADEDAAGPLFGVGARVFRGTDATPARLEATVELEGETDLGAAYRLALAVDGGAPVTVDLRAGAADAHHVTRAELRDAVNAALGAGVASLQGRRLALASPTEGSASRLEVFAREETVRRRFVTRAAVADDAATAILGFQLADARGTPPGLARIVGAPDLSR